MQNYKKYQKRLGMFEEKNVAWYFSDEEPKEDLMIVMPDGNMIRARFKKFISQYKILYEEISSAGISTVSTKSVLPAG